MLPRRRRFSPSCRPRHGDDGLRALLASPDLDAVLVVLPPQAQGAVIQAALRAGERRLLRTGRCVPAMLKGCLPPPLPLGLRAQLAGDGASAALLSAPWTPGKHVLGEKPAAPTLAQAEQLLAFHRSLPQVRARARGPGAAAGAPSRRCTIAPPLPANPSEAQAPLWCVAENYRSMPAFLRLRDALRAGGLGRLARLDMAVDLCECRLPLRLRGRGRAGLLAFAGWPVRAGRHAAAPADGTAPRVRAGNVPIERLLPCLRAGAALRAHPLCSCHAPRAPATQP